MDAQERLQELHMIAENEILKLKAALQDKVQHHSGCMYMSMHGMYISLHACISIYFCTFKCTSVCFPVHVEYVCVYCACLLDSCTHVVCVYALCMCMNAYFLCVYFFCV